MADNAESTKEIWLESLADGIPTIPEDSAGFFKQNCMVCFHSQDHASGVHLRVQDDTDEHKLAIFWEGKVTEQLLRAYGNDHRRTTDNGAVAVSLLLIRELTDYTAIEQAGLGTTIDYFLFHKQQEDDTLIFNGVDAYLEVRGIRRETTSNSVDRALREKINRLNTPEELPTFIIVVEFSQPWSRMAKYDYRA